MGEPRSTRNRIALPSLRIRPSERRLMLFIVDLLLIEAALLIALLLRTDFIRTSRDVLALWRWFLALAVVWTASALFFDCYNLARAASTGNSVASIASAALATTVIYTFLPVISPPLQSRSQIAIFAALAVATVTTWRVAYARLFVQPWFRQRALIVGAGHAGRALAAALRSAPRDANPFHGTGYDIVGFIDDDEALVGSRIEGAPVLGDGSRLVETARRLAVDEVVLAITHRHSISDTLFDALIDSREQGFRVTTMSVLYERLLGRVPVHHVGRDLHMVVPMGDSALDRMYRLVKRALDVVLALLGLVVVALLCPLIALANAITSPGPLLYRQERVGRGGQTFQMLKFRSMVPDAEDGSGAVWASRHDPRVTPIGRFLRRTRIDELPQTLNVLLGEMSLVGPRPERPEFVAQLVQTVPFYRLRHAVRPGITGWAQISYRYGSSVDDAVVKLEYDLYYVKHAGLWLDLRILLGTIPVVLGSRGS